MQKSIIINGTLDVTAWTPPVGYIVKPRYVFGGNIVTMQNGDKYKDEIAHKSDVTVPFMPLTDEQLSTLMSAVNANATCSLYFYDSDTGAYRTMVAYRTVDPRKFRGMGADGNYYWTGVNITFEEK